MTLLVRYDTPAFLPDFDSIPGQLEAWNKAVSAWFDQNIAADQKSFGGQPRQYYNAAKFDPGGTVVEQEITWNAFPKELLRRYGRERALVLAGSPLAAGKFRCLSARPGQHHSLQRSALQSGQSNRSNFSPIQGVPVCTGFCVGDTRCSTCFIFTAFFASRGSPVRSRPRPPNPP